MSSLSPSVEETVYPSPKAVRPERLTVAKPWGNFEQLTLNEATTVKIITVLPDEELSLQSHKLRSEWWIVLENSMEVVLDDQTKIIKAGDEMFIPQGAKHRAVGLRQSCRWLEISFGHFDEDDQKRYEDRYGRV